MEEEEETKVILQNKCNSCMDDLALPLRQVPEAEAQGK